MTDTSAMVELETLLQQIDLLKRMGRGAPDFLAWKEAAEQAIRRAFGERSRQAAVFSRVRYTPLTHSACLDEYAVEAAYQRGLDNARMLVQAMIREAQEDEVEMSNHLTEISPELIRDNVFRLVGTDWMLVTAGTRDSFNTMTASWGGMGVLWDRNICFCVIRPHRHTYGFMERTEHFTLSFFDEAYREALNFCGSKSGRNVDKVAATGLTPATGATGAVYFAEARLVLECRKIYFQDLNPANFLDPAIEENYPKKDYHRMYLGEILHCLTRG